MRCAPLLTLILLIAYPFIVHAEDADEVREKGIAALKDSQTNPHAIVEAARFFVKAAALYGDAGGHLIEVGAAGTRSTSLTSRITVKRATREKLLVAKATHPARMAHPPNNPTQNPHPRLSALSAVK